MSVLNVGLGQRYATISAAVNASRGGDTINVYPGTYKNDWVTVRHDLVIQGIPDANGHLPHLMAIGMPNGVGLIDQKGGALTVRNLEISGAYLPAGQGGKSNAAGVRYQNGASLTLDGDYVHNNGNGVLATANTSATIKITHTELAYNGTGDGYTHNAYIGDVRSFIFDQSYSHDAKKGDDIKSRAESTTITNSRIQDQLGTASYSIDLPNGGKATIQNNTIEQGKNSALPIIISYGEESNIHLGSMLTLSGNTILNDLTARTPLAVRNAVAGVSATVLNNQAYGLTAGQILRGAGSASGTNYLAAEPALNTSAPWPSSGAIG